MGTGRRLVECRFECTPNGGASKVVGTHQEHPARMQRPQIPQQTDPLDLSFLCDVFQNACDCFLSWHTIDL